MSSSTHDNLESSLWRRFGGAPRPLRIGVLADAEGIEAWLASAIESLAAAPEMEIADLFLLPDRRSAPETSPPWLFRKLDAWSRSGANNWFDLSKDLAAQSRRQALSGGDGAGLAPEDRALIKERQLDVLLCATSAQLTGDCANLARLGVWSFLLGEPELAVCKPAYWREVYEERDVSRLFLLVHDEKFERGRVMESFATATVPSLHFTQNQDTPLRAAGSLLDRSLRKATELGAVPPGEEGIDLRTAPRRWPSTPEILSFIGRKMARSARLRVVERGKTMTWFVAIRPASGGFDLKGPVQGRSFFEITAPPGHFYADPFIIERDSQHWLFVEDWNDTHGRGCLACMEVRADGSLGAPIVILEKPYHLSYPHVFSHGSDFFMIPETSEDATVQLYRATRFPYEWKLEAVLMEGAELVDTTPVYHEGTWYFFTNTASQPEEAYLFTAPRIDGPWQYHPANPICSDTRRLRSAGAVFSHQGALIRPVQDCSRGYGYAVVFNEICRLSPSEYQERETGRLLPTWASQLAGTHTFNFNSKYEAVDGRKLMPARR